MPNNIQHPCSVPAHLKGQTQEEFQGGKNKVLELFNTLDSEAFVKQLIEGILPREAAKWFALDCAKFVLPFFEKRYPYDQRVTNCIEVNESFLKGKSTLKELSDVAYFALSASAAADLDSYDTADNYDACTAVNAAEAADAAEAASDAAEAASDAANAAASDNAKPDAIFYAIEAAEAAISKDGMQAFIKNWIDNYFNAK